MNSKEETGDRARSLSDARVEHAQQLFLENFTALLAILKRETPFYVTGGVTYEESLLRVRYLKQVNEHNDGYRLFYDSHGEPIKREADLQVLYRFCWFGSPLDVNREVNNGRGPVDYKISWGAADATLVEFKLASNTQIRRNLENQVAVYEAANKTRQSIKVILFFDAMEQARIGSILEELGLKSNESILLIDARRDNKISGSKA